MSPSAMPPGIDVAGRAVVIRLSNPTHRAIQFCSVRRDPTAP